MSKPLDARAAEDAAADFLERQGYKVVRRNVTSSLGEIDIVAVDDCMVVFVEVKSRARTDYGPPEVAVDHKKQAKLRRLAQQFLERHNLLDSPCRFDVVALTPTDGGDDWNIEVFQDAF